MNVTIILFLWLIPIGINVYMDRNGAKRDYKIVFIFRGIGFFKLTGPVMHGFCKALAFVLMVISAAVIYSKA